jgi:hypothetical protein
MEKIIKLFLVLLMIIVTIFILSAFADVIFYKGQATQICNGKIETIYKKNENHYVLCSDKTVHKLLR